MKLWRTISRTTVFDRPPRVRLESHRVEPPDGRIIQSQAAVETFRRSGPSNKQRAAMLSVTVAEHDIADVRRLSGKGRA
jgi:hypothetical protein